MQASEAPQPRECRTAADRPLSEICLLASGEHCVVAELRLVANPIAGSGFRRTVKAVAKRAVAGPLLYAYAGQGDLVTAFRGRR